MDLRLNLAIRSERYNWYPFGGGLSDGDVFDGGTAASSNTDVADGLTAATRPTDQADGGTSV